MRIARKALRPFLQCTQWTLLAAGLLGLGWCASVVAEGRYFQADQSGEFDRMLTAGVAAKNERTTSNALQTSPRVAGTLMGRIEIERLALSVMFVEGTTTSALRRAAGHIEGTAIPGQGGNTAISAHRDTFFRPLRNVRENDIVVVTTLSGTFRYRVVSTRIVTPETVSVLDQGQDEILTLVTCYPFYFVGEAPSRFIVRALRIA